MMCICAIVTLSLATFSNQALGVPQRLNLIGSILNGSYAASLEVVLRSIYRVHSGFMTVFLKGDEDIGSSGIYPSPLPALPAMGHVLQPSVLSCVNPYESC